MFHFPWNWNENKNRKFDKQKQQRQMKFFSSLARLNWCNAMQWNGVGKENTWSTAMFILTIGKKFT